MPGRYFNSEFVLSTKFPSNFIYILKIFGEYLGCLFLATVRNVKKFLVVARYGQIFPKYGQYIYQIAGNLMLSMNSALER